ncbi:hypothetical protein GCM10010123_20890 [Pilimelia anulata]|uniref:Uncharacterized protein n=1 Tax=Pilimelia anulata TaxID=53371 RepID=A0A8J3B3K6_9ACTN|nr:HAD family hydrolase [Pilimelia anulata]GGJ90867.1 hypothetical protein GCM10010123_20890 [Pilimelia anulata]
MTRPAVEAIVFDADGTLLDLVPGIRGAEAAVVAHAAAGGVALAAADLAADARAEWARRRGQPPWQIRRAALRRSCARIGRPDLLDELTDVYFATRLRLTRPYPDVLAALAELRAAHVLGYATNGNSRAYRCGLADQFGFELYAHINGLAPKPAPAFFAAVLAAAGGPDPGRVLYVGDEWAYDIAPARAAGLRTALVRRPGPSPAAPGADPPPGEAADVTLASLADLPAALRTLAR